MKKTEPKVAKIPPIQLRTVQITLEGESPLLVHKFSEKSQKEMDDKQQQKAKNKKMPRDPVAEYEASLYRIPGKKDVYGMPASGIRLAAVSACRYVEGISMSKAKGAFHIVGDIGGLIPIKGKPVMDERIVRIGPFGRKVPMTRYRGRFDEWSVTFHVKYNETVIGAEQLAHLFENAGFSVGLCEYRPEKGGSCGMFKVKRN